MRHLSSQFMPNRFLIQIPKKFNILNRSSGEKSSIEHEWNLCNSYDKTSHATLKVSGTKKGREREREKKVRRARIKTFSPKVKVDLEIRFRYFRFRFPFSYCACVRYLFCRSADLILASNCTLCLGNAPPPPPSTQSVQNQRKIHMPRLDRLRDNE